MNGYRLTVIGRVIALTLCVGALPFLFCADAHAGETAEAAVSAVSEVGKAGEVREVRESDEGKAVNESRWLDDYRKPVGFTYGAEATLQASYLWRGISVGAFNLQGEARVGYGGLYASMWWSLGTFDWTFTAFQPEVDLIIGFSRWGLDVYAVYIHNFDCGFFNFGNLIDRGNNLEVGLRYTVSSKLPLRFLWATRVAAKDGYIYDGSFTPVIGKGAAVGDTVRAYSTYIEISYTHHFPYDISLYGAVGVSPWRSMYSNYKKEFVVENVEIRLRKDWSANEHCGLMVQGTLSICPWLIADDKSSIQWRPENPSNQSINANIGFGVYWK